ncbi:hypothetical protein [Enterococcus sp. LJL51]|uniref:hypothetical protein n=1 Tax=Enterococcus sp. LJL51 TaxID=3416656 RepID=UPI003CF311B2
MVVVVNNQFYQSGILCGSYLLDPKAVSFKNKKDYFISIGDQAKLLKIKTKVNTNTLEGAIILKYFDEELLSFEEWDLLDQLWCYLIDMVEGYLKEGQAETYFPDQPIRISFKKLPGKQLLFTKEGKEKSKWVLPEQLFLSVLLTAGFTFFEEIMAVFPVNYGIEKKQIEVLLETF